jgi:hypothetical protein
MMVAVVTMVVIMVLVVNMVVVVFVTMVIIRLEKLRREGGGTGERGSEGREVPAGAERGDLGSRQPIFGVFSRWCERNRIIRRGQTVHLRRWCHAGRGGELDQINPSPVDPLHAVQVESAHHHRRPG